MTLEKMLTRQVKIIGKDPSSDASTTRTLRFLTVLCIYLLVIVCLELIIIVTTLNQSTCQNIPVFQNESSRVIASNMKAKDIGHTISKRQVSGRNNGWPYSRTEQNYCPPGCIRKRRRKTSTPTVAMTARPESAVGYTERHHSYGDYYYGQAGSPGPRGPPGLSGGAGMPGSRGGQGAPGAPGLPGLPGGMGGRGEPGSPGGHGQRGSPGLSGHAGQAGEPGQRGSQGQSGYPGLAGGPGQRGSPGRSGLPGQQGAPGEAGYSYSNPTDWELRSGGRGDIGSPPYPPSQSAGSQLLRDLRLYNHPQCKDEVHHKALMDTLKETGKVTFMVLVDLQDNEYCILHT